MKQHLLTVPIMCRKAIMLLRAKKDLETVHGAASDDEVSEETASIAVSVTFNSEWLEESLDFVSSRILSPMMDNLLKRVPIGGVVRPIFIGRGESFATESFDGVFLRASLSSENFDYALRFELPIYVQPVGARLWECAA